MENTFKKFQENNDILKNQQKIFKYGKILKRILRTFSGNNIFF